MPTDHRQGIATEKNRLQSHFTLLPNATEVPHTETDSLAHPVSVLMKSSSQDNNRHEPSADPRSEGTAETVTSALRKTFESMLEEPVPERLQDLIERIRAEELSKTQNKDGSGQ